MPVAINGEIRRGSGSMMVAVQPKTVDQEVGRRKKMKRGREAYARLLLPVTIAIGNSPLLIVVPEI